MHNIYYPGLSGERSLPFGLLVLIGQGQLTMQSDQIFNSFKTIYFFLLPARMEKIKSETRIFRGSNYCLAIALSEDKNIQGHNWF